MRSNRIRELLFASFLASAAALAAAPASAQQPYDGLWQVTVVTKTGSCEPQTSSTVTVADGKISARRRFPAASAARDLCESRSMVHMRTVNSVATPDRGSGMGHQLAYRAAVDGKRPGSKIKPDIGTLRQSAAADIRSRRVFYGGLCGLARPRPVRAVRRHGRQLGRRRHRHARRRLERAHPLPRDLHGRRAPTWT